jgi:hypothetical protein
LKVLFFILLFVAIVCLVINLLLVNPLSRTRTTTEDWKTTRDQLALKRQETESEPNNVIASAPLLGEPLPRPEPAAQSRAKPSHETEVDAGGNETSNEGLRWILASVINRNFPELRLSDDEILELAATVTTIRSSLLTERALERTITNAETIMEHRAQLSEALERFEEIAGMAPSEFMRLVDADGGIDNAETDDEEIVTEYLSDFRP